MRNDDDYGVAVMMDNRYCLEMNKDLLPQVKATVNRYTLFENSASDACDFLTTMSMAQQPE